MSKAHNSQLLHQFWNAVSLCTQVFVNILPNTIIEFIPNFLWTCRNLQLRPIREFELLQCALLKLHFCGFWNFGFPGSFERCPHPQPLSHWERGAGRIGSLSHWERARVRASSLSQWERGVGRIGSLSHWERARERGAGRIGSLSHWERARVWNFGFPGSFERCPHPQPHSQGERGAGRIGSLSQWERGVGRIGSLSHWERARVRGAGRIGIGSLSPRERARVRVFVRKLGWFLSFRAIEPKDF
jgi:hypothetical protein